MKKIDIIIALFLCTMAFTGCSAGQKVTNAVQNLNISHIVNGRPVDATAPDAVIFRMNGDWADCVPVTLNDARTEIVSYPAPSDLLPTSSPMAIGNGWYLDRRGGIGENTAFTRYTFSEYRALPAAPSMEELAGSIIPDARVTATKVLPIKITQAIDMTPAELVQYLK